MTDVTENRDQAEAKLSAADEQVLRELTERARTGGLKLTGEGGLLGRLTVANMGRKRPPLGRPKRIKTQVRMGGVIDTTLLTSDYVVFARC